MKNSEAKNMLSIISVLVLLIVLLIFVKTNDRPDIDKYKGVERIAYNNVRLITVKNKL